MGNLSYFNSDLLSLFPSFSGGLFEGQARNIMQPGGSWKGEVLSPIHEVLAHSFKFLLPCWYPVFQSRACQLIAIISQQSGGHLCEWESAFILLVLYVPQTEIIWPEILKLLSLPHSVLPHPTHLSNCPWVFSLEGSVTHLMYLCSSLGHM